MNDFEARKLPSLRTNPKRRRSGQALVEFAIISFALVFIVAGLLGIVVMALGSFQNNIATENAGRLLDGNLVLIEENFRSHFSDSTDPDYLDPGTDFEDVTARQVYRFLNEYATDGIVDGPVVYDESRLIISLAEWSDLDDLELPAINRSLLGQYVFDPDIEFEGQETHGAYRFPGAVVTNQAGNRTVMIPLLPGPNGSSGIGRTLHIDSTDPRFFYPVSQDWVAPVVIGKEQDGDGFEFRIIMFHPSQPASMITIEVERDAQGRIVSQTPVEADDEAIAEAIGIPPEEYDLTPPLNLNPQYGASPLRGEFGLGESFAFATKVRPFRTIFETSAVFRMGARLNPIFVKYEYDEDGSPGPYLTDASDPDTEDQSLDFERLVIDRSSEDLRRYIVDPDAASDFNTNAARLLANDAGVWRITASAEFERDGSPGVDKHHLELRLYKNGLFERAIARFSEPFDQSSGVLLRGDVLTNGVAGDVFQVRVFTERPLNEGYEVRLNGKSAVNFVSFERVGD